MGSGPFLIGLNPYGLAYTVGLAGAGTPRANPQPIGLPGFVALAQQLHARCVELHGEWLAPLSDDALRALGRQIASMDAVPIVSASVRHVPNETFEVPVRTARMIGASLIRMHLSPVLEGARARWPAWRSMSEHAAATLAREASRIEDAGLTVAMEDHQDFGSEELVAMAEAAGPAFGVVFDTGNPFAVGEDPIAFARRAAHRIKHVHLKDYRAQFTDDGYRLVRCAIGDGAVPFAEIAELFRSRGLTFTASIEPGALEARHIRLFTAEWWHGYPPREAREVAIALGRLRRKQLRDDEPWMTPWEAGAAPDAIVAYEMDHVRRSAAHMEAL